VTAMLAFCRCGHVRDDHVAGCTHVNSSRRFDADARCTCRRFTYDALLDDAEAFVAKQLHQIMRKEGVPLDDVDKQDLLQVMRISLWRASAKYDSRSHIRFGSFAAFEVYNDAIDELRSARMFGRHGQYRLQPLLAHNDDDTWIIDATDPLDDDAAGSRRLERVIAELTVDAPDAGDIDLRWALTDGDREALGAAAVDGDGTDASATRGARDPAWDRGLSALISTRGAAA
jgi:DNA-directed RNA polymerase specialized sigma24 family protein